MCKKVKTVELKLAIPSTFIEVNWWLLKEGTTEILKHARGVIFDTITFDISNIFIIQYEHD